MSGSLINAFKAMERAIAADEVSPEDIVEKEETDPVFKRMRTLAMDVLGFRRLVRDQIERDD
ncbi:MAG: hypothetical protein IPM06_18185 [Rhizobiales bacterium]|nr:hypothetical protein [Hyphomicrobiales bacterium]